VSPGALLGEHEIAIDRHLERASARGHDGDLGNARFELLQEPLRQTDGSRGVASARAVLDGEPHDRRSLPAPRRQPEAMILSALARPVHARCGIDLLRKGRSCRNEASVRERLGKVAHEPPGMRVVLLRKKTDVVAQAQEPLE
jgi:hypothetical protein